MDISQDRGANIRIYVSAKVAKVAKVENITLIKEKEETKERNVWC